MKPGKGYGWIVVGICSQEAAIKGKYGFIAGTTDHGCYGFGTDGCSYSSSKPEENHKKLYEFPK